MSCDPWDGGLIGRQIPAYSVAARTVLQMAARQERETASTASGDGSKEFVAWRTGYVPMLPGMRYPLANSRASQYALLRSRAHERQVVHQATHDLARFFLEIEANHHQLRVASRLKQAAAGRLEAQRVFYEESRLSVNRYIEAIRQYSDAVATEGHFLSACNHSIASFEEAKGTLLADRGIVVIDPTTLSRSQCDGDGLPSTSQTGWVKAPFAAISHASTRTHFRPSRSGESRKVR